MHGRQASYPTDKGGRRDALGILLRYTFTASHPLSAAFRSVQLAVQYQNLLFNAGLLKLWKWTRGEQLQQIMV